MYRISIILSLLALSHTLAAQTVLVTGSNRGIGLEFVSQYAERDWDVIATSRSPMDDYDLQALAKKYKNIQIETLDVTDQHEIEALVAKLEKRPIDLLINNAGLLGDRSKQQWGEINKETFDQLMDVNVFRSI